MESNAVPERTEPMADRTDSVPAMRLESISKTYLGAETPAVRNLTLTVGEGEFVTLLGPSGCGKSTTLRIVAGLETADAGTIHFRGRPIVDVDRSIFVRPDRRNLGMVFQAYAIWPHMTVFQNVAFPLKARHAPRDTIRERVMNALALVGMDNYWNRAAPLLSGGQQQRVALARAVVTEPDLLLLDEPFSNLDAKLREQMRIETKLLQERVGVAVLFVTHDQTEALALSDRIAVMRSGVIEQQGSPRELYEQPATEFVRDFVGRTLIFLADVEDVGDGVEVKLVGGTRLGNARVPSEAALDIGQRVHVAVRPEDVDIVSDPGSGHLRGRVRAALFVGDRTEYQIDVDGQGEYLIEAHRRSFFERGAVVGLRLTAESTSVWPIRPSSKSPELSTEEQVV